MDTISEPDTSTLAPASAPARTPGQDLQSVDIGMMCRIIIVPEGAGYYPDHETTKAILDVVQRLYGNYFYTSWSAIPYETQLAVRKYNRQPFWLTDGQWEQLKAYWRTPEVIAKSEQAKAARASQKGGSLHTTGARSQGHVARKMVGYKEVIHEYKQTHSEGESAQPPPELEIERVMQGSLKSLEAQVRSHITCEQFFVPHSPPPHPDDTDDMNPEDDGKYVDHTPDDEMP
ncbi:hypothetical protein RND71_021798 [Anisodus tanguticus]|uniref:Uncharacterized protein n=1 Tax=Anisodus tanguticus TaxID=243964 RepID=A0AAE1RYH6_9SOLA|nr:hypothetical protein RND71_021798 [Anisodus tanguticus]